MIGAVADSHRNKIRFTRIYCRGNLITTISDLQVLLKSIERKTSMTIDAIEQKSKAHLMLFLCPERNSLAAIGC
jgi:hypothetical protein